MQILKSIKKIFLVVITIIFLVGSSSILSQNSVSISHKFKTNNSSKSNLKIEYEGDVTLSDDDKDIIAISSGGYIEIKKSSFGKRRRLVIENDGGELVRKYFIGWSEKPYYPEGKEWLAEILPEILRTTIIGAKSRVDKFYKKGGAAEVVLETRKIKSDYVTTAYLKYLLEKDLNTDDLVKVINAAGKQIDSNYYLSQILKKNQKTFLKNDKTIDAYINVCKNVSSDHYLTQIVKAVVNDKNISDNQLGSLLKIFEQVSSDHYLAQILTGIMGNRDLNNTNMNKVITLLSQISSDHYKTVVLKKALKTKDLSDETNNRFIGTLNDISSDHYATEVVKELVKEKLNNANLTKILGVIKNSVSSDHYATVLFKGLSKKGELTEVQVIEIIEAVGENISSSHYLSQTLLAYAPRVKRLSEKAKAAYTKVAKSINSDTYFGKVMKAIY